MSSKSEEKSPTGKVEATKMIRPAATEEDKAIFNQLLQKISAVDSYFCCGGTLELTDRPLTLYYKSETAPSGKSSCLDFRTLFEQSAKNRQTAINDLLEACAPAPHGRGDETVLDESYRLARELRQNQFALSIDLLSEAGTEILSTISTFSVGRLIHTDKRAKCIPNLTMIPRLYKLNAYAKNGFFKPHRDTPKGSDHIGTLMIALPFAHQGGALRVNHAGNEVVFNWDQQCSEGLKVQDDDGKLKMSLPWAFLFSDVEHEVLPVESGTRITIAYDIFSSRTDMSVDMGPPVTDIIPTTTPLYDEFVAALHNPSFLIKGAEVAISLSHSYPKPRRIEEEVQLSSEEFAAHLKGVDAIVYRAMKAAGFDVSLKAVIVVETYDYKSEGIPQDGYDPVIKSSWSEFGDRNDSWAEFLTTSDVFFASPDAYDYVEEDYVEEDRVKEDEYQDVVKAEFGARASPKLMWVKKPKDTFTNAGAHVAYSNEHTIDYYYAAAAFVLNVPPFGKGSRAFS